MDELIGNLKDGVRVIHPHHVISMSRERALELLRDHGDAEDAHCATLMLAGPVLTPVDVIRLANARLPMKEMTASVKLAIAHRMICAA